MIPKANQQIRGKTNALPTKEHLHEIIRRHQHKHGEGEQRQIGEESLTMRIFVHVADGIEMHETGDGVDDNKHNSR